MLLQLLVPIGDRGIGQVIAELVLLLLLLVLPHGPERLLENGVGSCCGVCLAVVAALEAVVLCSMVLGTMLFLELAVSLLG